MTRSSRCPACGKPAAFVESNPFRPFCSERCRLTDLGGWASERYRIVSDPVPEGSRPRKPDDGEPGAEDTPRD